MAKPHGSVRIGPISLFTLIIVLCLAVLTALSVTTSLAELSTTERQAATTTETYQLESVGQQFVADVDAALTRGDGALNEVLADYGVQEQSSSTDGSEELVIEDDTVTGEPVGGDLGRPSATEATPGTGAATTKAAPLSAAEKRALKTSCTGGCSSCADRKPADSRHIILGGTLLSAAIFGFPVFCLVCPVGLSFAMVFLLIALFGGGDVTWSVLIIPALIAAEVIFFRKWCSHLCPLSSFMSLIGRANRTFQPAIDDAKCPWCHLWPLRGGVRGSHQPASPRSGHHLQRVHPLPRLRRRVPRACHQLPAYRPQDSRRPGA